MHRFAVLCLCAGTLTAWSCPAFADRTDNPQQNRSGVSGPPTDSKDAPPKSGGEAPPEQGVDPKSAGGAGGGIPEKAAGEPKDDKASAEQSKAASKDKPAVDAAPNAMTRKPSSPSAEGAKDALAGAEGKGTRDKSEKPPQGSLSAAARTRKEIVLELQTELGRVGCYGGEIDGAWGPASSEALAAFGRGAHVQSREFIPSGDWLKRVKAKEKRVLRLSWPGGRLAPRL